MQFPDSSLFLLSGSERYCKALATLKSICSFLDRLRSETSFSVKRNSLDHFLSISSKWDITESETRRLVILKILGCYNKGDFGNPPQV